MKRAFQSLPGVGVLFTILAHASTQVTGKSSHTEDAKCLPLQQPWCALLEGFSPHACTYLHKGVD